MSDPGPLLALDRVTKRFGDLAAVDDVSFGVVPGTIHALIGPNGAGKTTLINLIDGALAADRGHVHFSGRHITRLPAHLRARRGLARTFQITSIFPGFSLMEIVQYAVLAAQRRAWQMLRPARRDRQTRERADDLLTQTGLAGQGPRPAAALSHGQKRQLEIAMALALDPVLLVMDEPMAGMGPEESAELVVLLRCLRQGRTILLVEHDMQAVFALADWVTVLVSGKVLADGRAEQIRADAAVRAAYLGTD